MKERLEQVLYFKNLDQATTLKSLVIHTHTHTHTHTHKRNSEIGEGGITWSALLHSVIHFFF